jgi:hypothetical protein
MARALTVSPDAQIAHAIVTRTAEIEAQMQSLMRPDESYDFNLSLNAIEVHARQAQYSFLEIGRHLRLMQVAEGSEFRNKIEAAGISVSYAYRMISLHQRLDGPRAKLAMIGVSKAIELLREDDTDLEALADGGVLHGATLDDVEKMTSRELREHLRKARAALSDQKATTDALVTKRDERIRKLQKIVDLGDKYPAIDKAEEYAHDIGRAVAALTAAVATIEARMSSYLELTKDHEMPADLSEQLTGMVRHAAACGNRIQVLVG